MKYSRLETRSGHVNKSFIIHSLSASLIFLHDCVITKYLSMSLSGSQDMLLKCLRQTMSVSLASTDVRADKKVVVLQMAHCLSSSGKSSNASRSASVTPYKK